MGKTSGGKYSLCSGKDGMALSWAKLLTVLMVQGCYGDHMGNALKGFVPRQAHRKCSE